MLQHVKWRWGPGSFRPTRTAIAKKTTRTNCGNSKPIRMEGNYMLKCSHWWQQLDFEKRKYAIKHIDIASFHAFTIISYVTITDQSQNWGRESAPAVRRNRTTRGICAQERYLMASLGMRTDTADNSSPSRYIFVPKDSTSRGVTGIRTRPTPHRRISSSRKTRPHTVSDGKRTL